MSSPTPHRHHTRLRPNPNNNRVNIAAATAVETKDVGQENNVKQPPRTEDEAEAAVEKEDQQAPRSPKFVTYVVSCGYDHAQNLYETSAVAIPTIPDHIDGNDIPTTTMKNSQFDDFVNQHRDGPIFVTVTKEKLPGESSNSPPSSPEASPRSPRSPLLSPELLVGDSLQFPPSPPSPPSSRRFHPYRDEERTAPSSQSSPPPILDLPRVGCNPPVISEEMQSVGDDIGRGGDLLVTYSSPHWSAAEIMVAVEADINLLKAIEVTYASKLINETALEEEFQRVFEEQYSTKPVNRTGLTIRQKIREVMKYAVLQQNRQAPKKRPTKAIRTVLADPQNCNRVMFLKGLKDEMGRDIQTARKEVAHDKRAVKHTETVMAQYQKHQEKKMLRSPSHQIATFLERLTPPQQPNPDPMLTFLMNHQEQQAELGK